MTNRTAYKPTEQHLAEVLVPAGYIVLAYTRHKDNVDEKIITAAEHPASGWTGTLIVDLAKPADKRQIEDRQDYAFPSNQAISDALSKRAGRWNLPPMIEG